MTQDEIERLKYNQKVLYKGDIYRYHSHAYRLFSDRIDVTIADDDGNERDVNGKKLTYPAIGGYVDG